MAQAGIDELKQWSLEQLAVRGRSTDQDAVWQALADALDLVEHRSRKSIDTHPLWPYRHLIYGLLAGAPTRGRAQAVIDAFRARGIKTDRMNVVALGRWLAAAMPMVEQEIIKRKQAVEAAKAEAAAREADRERGREERRTERAARKEAEEQAASVAAAAPVQVPAQPIAQPAAPAAREPKPIPSTKKEEGDLNYSGLSPGEIAAVNALQMPDARAAALKKIRDGHALRAQISADKAAEAEREAAAKSAAKSRSLEDFIAMKLDDMTIHDRREALERLHERGMVSPTIYGDYRKMHGHEDHYVAKIGQLLREARRKIGMF